MKARLCFCGLLLFLSIFYLSQARGQHVEIVGVEQIEKIIQNQSDTVHIINFWATWCAPCVRELPEFLQLHQTYQNNKVRIWLVSMDFRSSLESSLKPFLRKKNITHPVWLLNNTDYDSWISRIDNQWQGDIPFTLIFNNQRNKRVIISGETNYQRLEKVVREMF